jgi:hypothetical protein
MTRESSEVSRPVAPKGRDPMKAGSTLSPPTTMEERLQRIESLGRRVDDYIQFMCQIRSLNGSSAEAKERAVTAFYQQMLVVERQLGRIHEDLRLE